MSATEPTGRDPADLFKALGKLGNLLLYHVVPVMQDNERRIPHAIGTGILLNHLGQPYLVSASHVFDHSSDGALYFYSASHERRAIEGLAQRSPKVDFGGPTLTIDVGIVKLGGPGRLPLRLHGKGCFPSHLLWPSRAPHQDGRGRGLYIVTGFPASRTLHKRHLATMESAPWGFQSREVDLNTYAKEKIDPNAYLILHLERKPWCPNEQRSLHPDPHGMSGSPVWLLGIEGDSTVDKESRIAAVAITARIGAVQYLLSQATCHSFAYSRPAFERPATAGAPGFALDGAPCYK